MLAAIMCQEIQACLPIIVIHAYLLSCVTHEISAYLTS